MLTLILAACLAQPDWSGLQTRRDLGDAEKSEARDVLALHLRSYGIDELTRLADGIEVRRGVEAPVVFVEVITLDERRSLERQTEPYDGPQLPPPTVRDADPWAPPLPAWEVYDDHHWVLPVEGSEESQACPGCRGQRQVACAKCGADGATDCANCRAQGEVPCTSCDGRGRDRCGACGGDGRMRRFGENRRCTSCGGDGEKTCSRCRSGKVACPTCHGKKQVECQTCRGKKRLACATCEGNGALRTVELVHIHLVAETRTSTWTRLVGDVEVPAPRTGWGSVEEEGLEEAASRIPEEGLRVHVLALAKRRRDVAARPRGQLVRLAVVPCRWVEYAVAGKTYEALLVDGVVREEDSPTTGWIAATVEEAERLLAAGNPDEADRLARLALTVRPDHAAALDVSRRVVALREEAISQAAAQSRTEEGESIGTYSTLGVGAFVVAMLLVLALVTRKPKGAKP
ncbi:MAG: hypothetical protein AAB434_03640 [Planctomycetota bacterium]